MLFHPQQPYVSRPQQQAVRLFRSSLPISHSSSSFNPAAVRLVQQPYVSSSKHTSCQADVGLVRLVRQLNVSSSSRKSRQADVRFANGRTSRKVAVRLLQKPYVSSSSRNSHPAALRLDKQPHVSTNSGTSRPAHTSHPAVARYLSLSNSRTMSTATVSLSRAFTLFTNGASRSNVSNSI